jgi:thioredoxin reductase (NADPH)
LDQIPTTVFTPNEYAFIGLSEEQAIQKFGEQNIEVFSSRFGSLEISPTHPVYPFISLIALFY